MFLSMSHVYEAFDYEPFGTYFYMNYEDNHHQYAQNHRFDNAEHMLWQTQQVVPHSHDSVLNHTKHSSNMVVLLLRGMITCLIELESFAKNDAAWLTC